MRLGHRWKDPVGHTRECVRCGTLIQEAPSPKTGNFIKVYRGSSTRFWTPERPECLAQ